MNRLSQEELTTLAVSDPLAAVILVRRSFFSDIWPKSPSESLLTFKKINLAAANLKMGMQVMPFIVIVTALLNCLWTHWSVTFAWAAATLLFWYGSWRIFRPLDGPSVGPKSQADIYRVLAATSGFVLAYGFQGFLFWHTGDASNQMTVLLILLASSLASALTASWLPLSLLQVFYYVGIAAFLLASTGTGLNLGLAALATFFSIIMFGMIANLHAYSFRLLVLEDRKDELIEQLRASNRTKSEFLANMSHELRTPMNAILGFSEIIKDEVMGPNHQPIYKSYACDIYASGSHLLGLINDILDLSKIEAGKFELRESEFDLHDISENSVRMVALRIAEKQIKLNVQIPKGVVIWGDPAAFRQISLNVSSNAVKFTPQGGSIDCWLTQDAQFMTIHVRDTGCGIRAEDLERVFESFGQGRHDVAQADKGTGLGLPIVRGLMRAHGGDAMLISEVGKGTEIRLTIPVSRVRALPAAACRAA